MLTVKLDKPIKAVRIIADAGSEGLATGGQNDINELQDALEQQIAEMQTRQNQLATTLQCLDDMIAKCSQFYEQVLITHRKEITKLALEIARKVLVQKVKDGDYEIENILQEALKNVPVQQGITVHLNPEDLARCQEIQTEQPEGPLAQLTLVPDVGVGRADCWLETPKGIIQSFINEHINKIAEALEKAS